MDNLFVLIQILFICGVIYFMVGFHNIDVAWNLKPNEFETDIKGLKIADRNQVYIIGTNEMFISLFFFIISFILFIIYI